MNHLKTLKTFIGSWFAYPWYPIAFGAYPVLALLSFNVGQVKPMAGMRALLVSLLLAVILYLVLWLILRQSHRAAFLTMLILVLFFSYGHVYNLLSEKSPKSNLTPWLAGGWGILFLLFVWWATRPKLNFTSTATSLNVIALGLVIMSGWQAMSGSRPRTAHALGAANAPVETDLVKPENPPDVYFFLLDSYGRADLFKSAYKYDNSGFLRELEKRGFYVAQCSQTNYTRTELSLGSSLNMMYLQDLDSKFNPENIGRNTLWNSLRHSAVRYDFESMGYKTVAAATGFDWLDLSDADVFLSPPPFSSGMTEFEGLFLRTTLARYVQDWGWVDPDAVMAQNSRDLFNNIFDHVDDIAKMPEPTFAYLHLISPHPPFVFGPDGSPTNPADFWNEKRLYPADLYAKGYQNQLTYLNKKMLEAIDTILAESKTPPIIIIQGDHGPWLQPNDKHMWILNAYYLPGHNDKLYPTISPVNSFRLVFDTYFGGNYDMLQDISYYSPVPKLYDFSEIPNNCKP